MGNIFANPAPTDDDPDFKAFQMAIRPIFASLDTGTYERLEYALDTFMNVLEWQTALYVRYENRAPPPIETVLAMIVVEAKKFEFKSPRNANIERRLDDGSRGGELNGEIVLKFGNHFLYYIFMHYVAGNVFRRKIRIDLDEIEYPSEEDIHLAQVIHTCIPSPILSAYHPDWFTNQKSIFNEHPLVELVSFLFIDLLRSGTDADLGSVDEFPDYYGYEETRIANSMGRRTYLGEGESYDTDDYLDIDEVKKTINGVKFDDEAFYRKKKEIEALIEGREPVYGTLTPPEPKKFVETKLEGKLAFGFLTLQRGGATYIIPVSLTKIKSKPEARYKLTFKTPAKYLFRLEDQKIIRPSRFRTVVPFEKQFEKSGYDYRNGKITKSVGSKIPILDESTLHQILVQTSVGFSNYITVGNTLIDYETFVKTYLK